MTAEAPFVRLWRRREIEPWLDSLHPDVVLRSPITSAPFVGIELARAVYEVLLDVLVDVDVTGPYRGPDGDLYVWHATAKGRPVHGCDLLRVDGDGRITEVTVFVRPASGVAALATAMSGPVAARRRPATQRIAAVTSALLPPLARAIDVGAAFFARVDRGR